jgi:hypothetical protein
MASFFSRLMGRRPARVAPEPEKIRPPLHCHIFWSATRTRHFARILSVNPKRRGTYDENIRLLNAAYSKKMGKEAHVRLFMQRVNPILFARAMGWDPRVARKLIGYHSWNTLYKMVMRSKCEHCRAAGNTLLI